MQQETFHYADLILPLAVPLYYTYFVPDAFTDKVKIGTRVTVVLGKRRIYTGIIRKIHNSPPEGFKISPILSVLDDKPLVTEMQIHFWEWLADYYMCTPGEVYRAALPSDLKLESESQIYPTPGEFITGLTETEFKIYETTKKTPGISIHKLAATTERKDIMPVIKNLIEKEYITLKENLVELYKPLLQDYIVLTEHYRKQDALRELLTVLEKKAAKQARVLIEFLHLSEYADKPDIPRVAKEKLLNSADISASGV